MMKAITIVVRVLLAGGICTSLVFGFFHPTTAQVSDPSWSQPVQLSSPNADAYNTGQPTIISDRYGIVHAFWPEKNLSDGQTSLMYAQFAGSDWSQPVSLITQPGMIHYPRVTIDEYNYLHLVWVGSQTGPVIYMMAHALQAGNPSSWTSPVIINKPAFQAVLYSQKNGILHLIYSGYDGPQGGMWHVQSPDHGKTWDLPVNLDPSRPLNYFIPQMYVQFGTTDDVHIIWWYMQTTDMSSGAVMYARSVDSGQSWYPAITIDDSSTMLPKNYMGAAAPRMAVSGSDVIIIWACGPIGGVTSQRYTSLSSDSGATWSPRQAIASFGALHGQAFDGIAVDGDGRVHYLADIRYPQGFYQAIWDSAGWQTPVKFFDIVLNPDLSSAPGSIHVHYASAVVRAGNQLVVIFMNSPNDPQGKVYAMYRDLPDVVTPPNLSLRYYFPFISN